MRKLRRLPWRIPKSHHTQSAAAAPAEVAPAPVVEPERQTARHIDTTQPVAFAGGRYVYGMTPKVSTTTEIRRKTHRTVSPLSIITAPR
jgi:hypothetical protein